MISKDMARSDWTRVRAKEQIILPFSCKDRKGKISLLKMLDVSEPFRRVYGGEEIVLAADGYYWLQLALEGEHAWFTVMFDDHGNLLQIYVDVTNGNDTDKDNPTFEDLFLDYVVYGDTVYELDRNELEDAYSSGVISYEQYQTALSEGEKLNRCLRENLNRIQNYFIEQYINLQNLLEQTEV